MTHRIVLPALMLVAALPLASLPAAAAQEVYRAVFFRGESSGATRIPHTGSSGSFQPLSLPALNYQSPIGNNLTNFNVTLSAPPAEQINGAHYDLAYADVAGGEEGGAVALPDSQGQLPTHLAVQVGTANIDVTYVYFPAGGECAAPPCTGNSSAAVIGEVGEAHGDVLYDFFVDVFSPETSTQVDSSLTHTGNYLGAVATTNVEVRINADAPPLAVVNDNPGSPRDLTFDRWVSGPEGHIAARNLDVGKGANDYALALYRSACPAGYHWHATASVSQCAANACSPGEFWNASANKCTAGCPPGEQCGSFTCPAECPKSCLVVPPGIAFNKTNKPIFACEPLESRSE